MKIEKPPKNMRGLRLVGGEESGDVSINFGPVRAGLTTTHRTQQAQLEELLSSLESRVATLESRYCEVLDTFLSVTERLVRLGAFTNAGITIEKESENE
jgi:hypothetical protein